MRTTVAALAMLLLSACGGDPTPHERLVGSWFARLSESPTRDIAIRFGSDGSYRGLLGEPTASGIENLEAEEGTFTATDSRLTQFPARSSCVGPSRPAMTSYRFAASNLVLEFPSGLISLAPVPETQTPGQGGAARYGCFDKADPSKFTAGDLLPVSGP